MPLPSSPLLAGRTILVTGAGKRLGRALAAGVVDAGADVILWAHHSIRGAEEVAQIARGRGQKAKVFHVDLYDRTAVTRAAVESIRSAPGERIDGLIHAAASFEKMRFDETTDEIWDRVLELNLSSPFRLVRELSSALSSSTSPGGGSVILLADLAAFLPFPDHFAHSVAKGGIVSLTRSLARSLAPSIRVNAIAPGPVLPPDTFDSSELERATSRIPMGDAGGPDEVVRAALHLLGATRITGEILRVDGGRGLR